MGNNLWIWFMYIKKRKICMKMSLCMGLLALVGTWTPSWGQTERLTLKQKNVSMLDVIRDVERQSRLTFVYNTDAVDGIGKVCIDVKNVLIDSVMNICLRETGYSWNMERNVVVIKKKRKTATTECEMVKVRGTVTDCHGGKLPGVSIYVKETTIGVVSDINGAFVLELPASVKTLVFSFVGMKTQEVSIDGKQEINVVMEEVSTKMEEVVVTGYGNIAKGNYTGAAYTVKGEDVLMAGVSTIDQMLQGVVPGMLVTNRTGLVGASSKIRIRGTSTLLGSQEPVWVVDGVVQRDPQPFNSDENTNFSADADDIKELAGNAISWLNPNDIESITVLKDASATAIYGSQAANGVIVITTKKAQAGKVQVNYSGDFSIGQRPRYGLYDLMNSAERMQLSKEIYEEKRYVKGTNSQLAIGFDALLQRYRNNEATISDLQKEYDKMARQNTDWFKILFRNSFNHSHNISISGGAEKIQNRTSFSFLQENGEARGNGMTQFSATSNTTFNVGKRLTMNFLLNGSIRQVEGFAYDVDPFKYAYLTSRAIPCYNEDGSLCYHEKGGTYNESFNTDVFNYNIVNEQNNTGSKNKTRTWGATIDLQLEVLPGLKYQGLLGYTSSSADTKQWATEHSYYITAIRGYEYGAYMPSDEEINRSPLPYGGLLETDLTNTTSITVQNSLVYDKMFGEKHRMTLQLGIETNSLKTEGQTDAQYGYLPDRGETFSMPPLQYYMIYQDYRDNATYAQGAHSVLNRVENKMSEYGMAVYTYDNRYVLNLSGRVDASNRFGQDKNKRFQPTWSVGLKWRVFDEPFARRKWWANNLDVYASYGYQGNAVSTVSPELITSFTNEFNYNGANSQKIVSVPYPDLGWEKTKTWNVGVDGALLNGRLNFTVNYFQKTSKVLSSRAIPFENGNGNGIVGSTIMKNNGYDLILNLIPVKAGDFTWQLSLNTSVTKNSMETKRENLLSDFTSGSCIIKGRPFSTFYSYVFTGLDKEYGQPLFKNITQYGSGSSIAESVDNITDIMVESGKFTPDFSGGMNTMFKWRNISLYALFAVQWGGHNRLPDIFNMDNGQYGYIRVEQNVSTKLKNRWKHPGDVTDIPSIPGTGFEDAKLPVVLNENIKASTSNRYNLYNLSTARVANTDFIRCRSLSLNYDFAGKWMERMGISYLSLKATVTNPFMWVSDKSWEGLDPETGDWPTRRTTSLSIKLMF
ncbi:SusC/RagA family TonB-linked outer membrane protein [Odoribacter splanchnicus]|uniref:SusC/RagA family TonB-linked outer membrane protein n=2 Tax=Odoribacter splanchnicus TaxID=28118 RepID=UPI0027953F21|nr:SusC/RagA family TonB-linked outer membrane protein [Odoribacter splanchnicus]